MSEAAKMTDKIVGQIKPGTRTAVVADQPDMEFEILDINDTGISPVEFRCVVRLDPKEKVTAGGIHIPEMRRDRDQMAATEGTLLACGGNAFQDWNGRKPEPGDRIMLSKYAGITREADPTDLVRVVNDKEILAVLT